MFMTTPLDPRRFTVATKLNREELQALQRLTEQERLPAAQILRRLIWRAAEECRGAKEPERQEAFHA